MGNSILPITNEYNENNLHFNEESSINDGIANNNSIETDDIMQKIEVYNNFKEPESKSNINSDNILQKRIEQIEETTFSNLKLLSDDVHHLFELYNNLKLLIDTKPPIVI